MKIPDIFGIIVCWMIRKRMQWFPRWKEYFALSARAHQKSAEFYAAVRDYATRASTRSRGFLTRPQAEHVQGLYDEAIELWKAADRLMHAPDMHHITTGEEPA